MSSGSTRNWNRAFRRKAFRLEPQSRETGILKKKRNKTVTVETTYLGERFAPEATHVQSGSKILTDAPTDNHGKGEAFSPTDLVAANDWAAA